MRILLVDDNLFVLEVLTRLLTRDSVRFEVVASATHVEDGLIACRKHRPQVVLLDINLPGQSGIEGVPRFKKACPKTRILLCTAEATDERIMDALRSGADGFIEKTNKWSDLTEALERVAAGEHYFCPRSSAALSHFAQNGTVDSEQRQLKSLTERERQVLELVSRGNSSKEMAAVLRVSVGTVDAHRSNVMKKLGIRNVAGLVAFSFKVGLLANL
jgi:DNA-binding NarL/FixJ family response regulator